MKALIINGSPKGEGSNTMKLTRAFIEGAKWTDVEIIDISKMNLQGCKGCFSCWTKTPGKCVIKDDMAEHLPKFIEADVVIYSFPLYCCYFPGQLKNFQDRMLPLAIPYMDKDAESGGHPSRYDFSKMRGVYISTCGFWRAEGNYGSIHALLERNADDRETSNEAGRNVETIFVGQGELFNAAETEPELKKVTDPFLDVVRCAGEEFAQGKITEETKKLLAEPLFPKEVFESFADASWEIGE